MENKRDNCPCCGYPTLPRRIHPQMPQWDICVLCKWEDDGQTDNDADKVYGGPNGNYSLTEARDNFRKYLVMFSPDDDTRTPTRDLPEEIALKKSLIELFEESRISNDEHKKDENWVGIIKFEKELHQITRQKIDQHLK